MEDQQQSDGFMQIALDDLKWERKGRGTFSGFVEVSRQRSRKQSPKFTGGWTGIHSSDRSEKIDEMNARAKLINRIISLELMSEPRAEGAAPGKWVFSPLITGQENINQKGE